MQNFPLSFYFELSFQNAEKISFKEVSGLATQMSEETIEEGGKNQFKWRVPIAPRYANLVLKRGMVSKDFAFMKWCADGLGNSLESPIQSQDLLLSLLDPNGVVVKNMGFS